MYLKYGSGCKCATVYTIQKLNGATMQRPQFHQIKNNLLIVFVTDKNIFSYIEI